ncbi:MAG: hypothetical protein BWZ10_01591 [candidate division BRC1 bacterium ADurb.BinA364]|nr:MAG: hypothetical protein BWZ10_01591 [candidate division BRC1 bacterium ADurb.BinA364]
MKALAGQLAGALPDRQGVPAVQLGIGQHGRRIRRQDGGVAEGRHLNEIAGQIADAGGDFLGAHALADQRRMVVDVDVDDGVPVKFAPLRRFGAGAPGERRAQRRGEKQPQRGFHSIHPFDRICASTKVSRTTGAPQARMEPIKKSAAFRRLAPTRSRAFSRHSERCSACRARNEWLRAPAVPRPIRYRLRSRRGRAAP